MCIYNFIKNLVLAFEPNAGDDFDFIDSILGMIFNF